MLPELDQEIFDLDWYALDKDGMVGHFTTAGAGAIPESVVSAPKEDFDNVVNYFQDLFTRTSGFTSLVEGSYIGLFSFEAVRSQRRPVGYRRISSPSVPLLLAKLPPDVVRILKKTVIPFSFKKTKVISLEMVTGMHAANVL